MSNIRARRTGALTAALALAATLLTPGVAAASPSDHASGWDDAPAAADARERVREAAERAAAGDPATFRGASATDDELSDSGASADLRFACPDGRVPTTGFTDLGTTFPDEIECLVWYGITQGRTASTYDPTATVNRAQMAVFIHRLLDDVVDLPAYDGSSVFRDLGDRAFGAPEANVLASAEFADRFGEVVVTGVSADRYDPGGSVTRAQMGSFIARAFRAIAADAEAEFSFTCEGVFRDEASIPAVHLDNVKLLCGFRIAEGRADGTYGPSAFVNRGQMAAFLMRTVDVFAQQEIILPPDARQDDDDDDQEFEQLFVDQTACDGDTADGTQGSPFCAIQDAVDVVNAADEGAFDVFVASGDAVTYGEDVVLDVGADVVAAISSSVTDGEGDDAQFVPFPVAGTLSIDTADGAEVYVLDFDLTAPEGQTAVTVTGDGDALLFENAFDGATAVTIDGSASGRTVILASSMTATERVLDVVAFGAMRVSDSRFVSDGAEAFVLLPADEDPEFLDNFTAEIEENVFDPADPEKDTLDGRPALVPASAG